MAEFSAALTRSLKRASVVYVENKLGLSIADINAKIDNDVYALDDELSTAFQDFEEAMTRGTFEGYFHAFVILNALKICGKRSGAAHAHFIELQRRWHESFIVLV